MNKSIIRLGLLGSLGLASNLLACSQPGAAHNDQAPRPTATPHAVKENGMSPTSCANDAVNRSVCMVRLIADDVEKELGGVDGGGISEIRAVSSTSYTVSLPREERVQQFTYKFVVKDGSVAIAQRTETTKSF